MIEKIHSFNLIYSSTLSHIWLQRNEGLTSTTHAPALSNLNTFIETPHNMISTKSLLRVQPFFCYHFLVSSVHKAEKYNIGFD